MRDTVTIYPARKGGLSFTYELTLEEAKRICLRYALDPMDGAETDRQRIRGALTGQPQSVHERGAAVIRVLKELWGIESNMVAHWPNLPSQVATEFVNTPAEELPQWVLGMYARIRPEG